MAVEFMVSIINLEESTKNRQEAGSAQYLLDFCFSKRHVLSRRVNIHAFMVNVLKF